MPELQAARGATVGASASAAPRLRTPLLAYALGVAGFAADLAAKTAALAHLDPSNPPRLLGGLLTLQLVRNPGAAFSMGEDFTVVLSVIALIAFAFVAFWLIPRVRHRGWAVAEGFLLAGITGNLADRLFREPAPLRGHVVDFLQLPHFAIFNVADMFITAAAILIVWFVLIGQHGPDGAPLDDAKPRRGRTASEDGEPGRGRTASDDGEPGRGRTASEDGR